MADIKPFRAVRPTRDKAHLVASRPVSTYKNSILAAKLEENPYTFIHIIHPEFFEDEDNKTLPNSIERFQKVKSKYEEFLSDGILTEDSEDKFYIYRQTKDKREYIGVIAGASVKEYNEGLIKKHEATLTSREEMFTNYLNIVGINAEPVLLSHPSNKNVDLILTKVVQDRPEYEFSTTDLVKHELWVVPKALNEDLIAAFQEIPKTYIADGHHRSASSARLSNLLSSSKQNNEKTHDYFLSFLIDEKRLNILPFNRICKSLNGYSKDEIINQLSTNFEIEKMTAFIAPQRLHDIHMFIDHECYLLRCKEHILRYVNAVDEIDADILTRHVLDPVLNIKDLKTDDNIQFVSGENGIEEILNALNTGKYKIGFALFPVTIEQLKKVADKEEIMPPKSTWVEPKMRSGLTIYTIK